MTISLSQDRKPTSLASLPAVENSDSAPSQLLDQTVQMHTGGGLGAYCTKVWTVAAKDLRAELRAKEVLSVMVTFSTLAVIVFGMAFDLRVPRPTMVAPGVLWVVLLFTGLLGLNRSFGAEMDRGTLTALLLAPLERSALYLGKFIASLLFMLVMLVFLAPMILFIFDVNLFQGWILGGLLLGVIGYVAAGTMFAALTTSTRARESMLPILLLPVMAPVFMAGLKVTEAVLDGRTFGDFQHWLGMLVAFDLIFLTMAFFVFDLIWEDV